MARKKPGSYGPETLHRVQRAWADYQDRTGARQADGAKSLGMGTSGFNQYLRGGENGGVPLNTNFLLKFAAMVGLKPNDLAPELETASVSLRPTTITLPVMLTLAGRRPKNRSIMVNSVGVVDPETTFVVEVDLPHCGVEQGAMLIVAREAAMEGELTLIDHGDAPPIFGTLQYDDRDKVWWVAQTVGGIAGHYTIQGEDTPLRVMGIHYPRPNSGRTFTH